MASSTGELSTPPVALALSHVLLRLLRSCVLADASDEVILVPVLHVMLMGE